MADNAAARAIFRAAADQGRRAAERVGVRSTSVTIRVRVYSGAVGAHGVTLVSTTDTVLSPSPRVTQISEGRPSYFGGGVFTDSTGRVVAGEYAIGPITPSYPGGGYDATDLAPAGAVNKRVTVLLAGDEFQTGGEEFEVLKLDATAPLHVMLAVARVRQGT